MSFSFPECLINISHIPLMALQTYKGRAQMVQQPIITVIEWVPVQSSDNIQVGWNAPQNGNKKESDCLKGSVSEISSELITWLQVISLTKLFLWLREEIYSSSTLV